jgi:mono/diheme cytochrome c family protein
MTNTDLRDGHSLASTRGTARLTVIARVALLGAPVAAAIVLAACASQKSATSDTSAATSVAATTTAAPPTTPAPTTAAPTIAPAPTTTTALETPSGAFGSSVLPILQSNCVSCHSTAGPGASHLLLATAADAEKNADFIYSAVADRYMPPWPAGDGDLAFHDDRRLTEAQLESLKQWSDGGGSIDVAPDTQLVASGKQLEPIERDAVMVGAPYKGSTAMADDYRCQIYDPELTETSYLQNYGIEADQTEVVHHALVFRATADLRKNAETADINDPTVGWSCFGIPTLGGNDIEQIMSWGPGQAPTVLPADTGIEMAPGDFLITQIHYHYSKATNALPADETVLVADFASDAVIAAAGGTLDPITLTIYLGPAEIPCSTRQSGPLCDRAAVQAELAEQYGLLGAGIADALMFQCGAKLEDFAAMTDGKASSTCDLPVNPGQIISVWGHMHEIGAAFKMTLNPGTPEERVILDIPKWDFDWQLNYAPVEAVVLKETDVVRVECFWDRSVNKVGREPRYIMWSEGTNDEMCWSQIVTRPTKP